MPASSASGRIQAAIPTRYVFSALPKIEPVPIQQARRVANSTGTGRVRPATEKSSCECTRREATTPTPTRIAR
jgi:hypothetical protein